MALNYIKAEPTRLRDLGFDERWLQDRINEDPSLLGLGDLVVISREQERTDLLRKLEEAGIYSGPSGQDGVRLRLSEKEIKDHEALVREVLAACEKQYRE